MGDAPPPPSCSHSIGGGCTTPPPSCAHPRLGGVHHPPPPAVPIQGGGGYTTPPHLHPFKGRELLIRFVSLLFLWGGAAPSPPCPPPASGNLCGVMFKAQYKTDDTRHKNKKKKEEQQREQQEQGTKEKKRNETDQSQNAVLPVFHAPHQPQEIYVG